MGSVRGVHSDRSATFASHHFPVVSSLSLSCSIDSSRRTEQPRKIDWGALRQPDIRRSLVAELEKLNLESEGDLDQQWTSICQSSMNVCTKMMPTQGKRPNKPWISQSTMELIEDKRKARLERNFEAEKDLNKKVRGAAKKDRARWLEELTSQGDWQAIRYLRKGPSRKQGRLKSIAGVLVCSEDRADTFAEYLEKIQWKVRPAVVDQEAAKLLAEEMPVSMEPFTEVELQKAIRKTSTGKSTKEGDFPAEYFKALAAEPSSALKPVLDLCNNCLCQRTISKEWATAAVAVIFKKGDPSECGNYKPICLLSVCQKLFMSKAKQRLIDAGAEQRLWPTQFGFRAKRSIEDAIFIARRRIEIAKAKRGGQITLLALDWAKAFDSINVESLVNALKRFGLPLGLLEMITSFLQMRAFYVRDAQQNSQRRPQRSGISQGCVLSPLLFIMVMTVLLRDVVDSLGPEAGEAYWRGDLADLVYADDTLLMGVSSNHLGEFLESVALVGHRYGMELHWDKFQVLPVQTNPEPRKPTGEPIAARQRENYLGTVLSADIHDHHELVRRIALAKSDFMALEAVWHRSALTWRRKLYIFSALVESRLMYSLSTICLTVAQERKLKHHWC